MYGPSAKRSFVSPLVTTGIWATAVAGMAYWVLQFPKPVQLAQASAVVSAHSARPDLGVHAAKALGQKGASASAAGFQTASQFKLLGVIAKGAGGSALIAINGQAPKAFLVGQTVHDNWVLTSLSARQVRLQTASENVLLDLPSPDKP